VFRDDDEARRTYLAGLERTAARVEVLERRIRELEAETRRLGADNQELRRKLGIEPPPSGETYVDAKLYDYAAALVRATDPSRTEGIVRGAPAGDAAKVIERASQLARDARRPYVIPAEVARAARELLPPRITLRDPDADPADMVRAIVGVVPVP
jgi:hypothetical protein